MIKLCRDVECFTKTWTNSLPPIEPVSLSQSSNAGHPPVQLYASPGPSHIFAPADSALPIPRTSGFECSSYTDNEIKVRYHISSQRDTHLGMVLVKAEHRLGVQLLLSHHQLKHLLAVSTHDQLQSVLVLFQRKPKLWGTTGGKGEK